MTGSVARGAAFAVLLLFEGVRLLIEPAQHASVITLGVLHVFLAGMFAAVVGRTIADKRRRGSKQ